jgi:hypothetical protein
LLPPGDIRAAKRVRPQAGEVASVGGRGLVERIAYTRIPQRPAGRPLLLEDECLRISAVVRQLLPVAINDVADTENTPSLVVRRGYAKMSRQMLSASSD